MFPSLRRIKILLSGNGAKKRDRGPHSLQDCIEKTPTKKSWVLKLFFVSWLLGVVFYYLLCFNLQVHVVPSHPYLEVLPENEVQAVTETKSMADAFIYERDPYKIKDIFKKAEQNASAVSTIVSIHTAKNESKESDFISVTMGGYFIPRDCRPRYKVGILVPYRDREEHLAIFLYNIHPFLMRQKLEYRIFVIEQYGKEPFNRGRLFNAGFLQIQQMGHWPCVVFHDVDLLPTDDRILYNCPNIPRHMCATVTEKKNITNFRTLFGGVVAMTTPQFRKVNGYSNMYWGWGGEDNDMFWRLKTTGLGITRYSKQIAQYTSLPHESTPVNKYRYELLKTGVERYKTDGLSDIHYTVVSFQIRHLYTHILIDINPRKENVEELMKSLT